ncbi:MAG TPA: hypothetical protein VII33_02255, partial [Nakamurella sp.]
WTPNVSPPQRTLVTAACPRPERARCANVGPPTDISVWDWSSSNAKPVAEYPREAVDSAMVRAAPGLVLSAEPTATGAAVASDDTVGPTVL